MNTMLKQQRVDELRRGVADLLERRALAADKDAVRRIDGEIEETSIELYKFEHALRETP